MGLKSTVEGVWDAVVALIEEGITIDQPGVVFHPRRNPRAGRTQKNIVTLSRVEDYDPQAVQLVEGNMTVEFGILVQSGDPQKGQEDAEELAYWLAELFLDNSFLGGKTRDVHVGPLEHDMFPPEDFSERDRRSDTQQWVGLTAVWRFDYSRP